MGDPFTNAVDNRLPLKSLLSPAPEELRMSFSPRAGIALLCLALCASARAESRFTAVHLVPGTKADAVEQRYVELLRDRIAETTTAPVRVGPFSEPASAELVICIGTLTSHPELATRAHDLGVVPPGGLDPGEEGFVLASKNRHGRQIVLAIGSDRRGVLYAVGEILRRIVGRGDTVLFPAELDLRSCTAVAHARADRFAGLHDPAAHRVARVDEGRVAAGPPRLRPRRREHVRARREQRPRRPVRFPQVIRTRHAGRDRRQQRQRSRPSGRLRKRSAARATCVRAFPRRGRPCCVSRSSSSSGCADFDYVHFKSGDGGGDESEASAPFGRTLIYLCEDYARILHKYHPHTKIFVGNQKLDNAGDRAIFQYLQEKPRDWIDGIVYGPGSNAMGWMPGRRQDHRMDLFEERGAAD